MVWLPLPRTVHHGLPAHRANLRHPGLLHTTAFTRAGTKFVQCSCELAFDLTVSAVGMLALELIRILVRSAFAHVI